VITSSPKAFDLVYQSTRGIPSYYKSEHFITSAEYFKKAFDMDPNFTAAYAAILCLRSASAMIL